MTNTESQPAVEETSATVMVPVVPAVEGKPQLRSEAAMVPAVEGKPQLRSEAAMVPAVEGKPQLSSEAAMVPAVEGKPQLRSEAVKANTVEVTTSSSQGDDTAGLPIPGDVPKERDVPLPVEAAPTQPPEKPQARVKPLKLLSNTEGNEAHKDGAFDTIRCEEFSSESPGPDSTSIGPRKKWNLLFVRCMFLILCLSVCHAVLTSMESLPPDVKSGENLAVTLYHVHAVDIHPCNALMCTHTHVQVLTLLGMLRRAYQKREFSGSS